MDPVVNLSKLLSDGSRVKILTALMSEKTLTPGELAIIADVTPQTISSHLNKLTDGGLITHVTACRHKYYYLISDKIADLLETMYQLAPMSQFKVPLHHKISPDLKRARTCYKHLAGNLAVTICNNLIKNGYLTFDGKFHITISGKQLFTSWGMNLDDRTRDSSSMIKSCMDWTERKFHIGGIFGKEMLSFFLKNDWIRKGHIHRTIYLTETGKRQLGIVKLI